MMTDLPSDQVAPDLSPFTNTVVDFFGPFHVKQGRSLVKHYDVFFTCLVTHSINIKMTVSLDADAFANALMRFIARRGQVKSMRSDNGMNFVGTERKLCEYIQAWNQSKIMPFLLHRRPPNLDQKCKIPWLRPLLFWEVIEHGMSNLTYFQNPVYLNCFCFFEVFMRPAKTDQNGICSTSLMAVHMYVRPQVS